MADTVTARDANQRFSRLLAEVEAGREVVITKRGRPVARLVPATPPGPRKLTAAQEKAWAETLELARQPRPPVTEEPLTSKRDWLYERD